MVQALVAFLPEMQLHIAQDCDGFTGWQCQRVFTTHLSALHPSFITIFLQSFSCVADKYKISPTLCWFSPWFPF